MFARTLVGNSVGVCGTMDIMLRRVGRCNDCMLCSDSVMDGVSEGIKES